MTRRPLFSSLFPYTTLFRSNSIGLLAKWGALDFAGGTVVHIAAGMAGLACCLVLGKRHGYPKDRKSTRLNSSHRCISYAVFCLKKKKKQAPHNNLIEHNENK